MVFTKLNNKVSFVYAMPTLWNCFKCAHIISLLYYIRSEAWFDGSVLKCLSLCTMLSVHICFLSPSLCRFICIMFALLPPFSVCLQEKNVTNSIEKVKKKWSCVNVIRHSFGTLCWCLINKHVQYPCMAWDVRLSLRARHSNAEILISTQNSNAIHCNAVTDFAASVWTVQINVALVNPTHANILFTVPCKKPLRLFHSSRFQSAHSMHANAALLTNHK